MEEWNSYYVHKSRFQTVSSIPNNLYFLPQGVDATDHKHLYNPGDGEINNELQYLRMLIPCYIKNISYARQIIGLGKPESCGEALTLYCMLLEAAQ